MMLVMLALGVSFVSCSDDDEPISAAEAIIGTYSGEVQRLSDGTTGTGYVTLTRASENAVFLTLFKCETLDIELTGNYELNIAGNNNSYKLTTGSNYQITGSVINQRIELTVNISGRTYVFSGNK